MRTPPASPLLLRRIAHLEAVVGRLSADLSTVRSAAHEHGLLPQTRRRSRTVQAEPSRNAPPSPRAAGGFAGAVARGEAARVQWVKQGLVVPGSQLAQAWGLTRQALAPASARGEVFVVKVGNRLYYPQSFLFLTRDIVAAVCRALGDLDASEKLVFWLRDHGALGGKSVAAALDSGVPLAKVQRLALSWARERGGVRGAAAA